MPEFLTKPSMNLTAFLTSLFEASLDVVEEGVNDFDDVLIDISELLLAIISAEDDSVDSLNKSSKSLLTTAR